MTDLFENMDADLKEQVKGFKDTTKLSDETLQGIVQSPIHSGGNWEESEAELGQSALRDFATEENAELLQKAAQRTGLDSEDIGKMLAGSGVDAGIALESLTTHAVAIHIERITDKVGIEGQDDVIEALKNTGADISTAIKVLADKIDPPEERYADSLTENIDKKMSSFVDRYNQENSDGRER